MAIRFKRRNSGAVGAPTALLSGQPAWNNVDKILYLGTGDDGSGNATSIEAIAGEGHVLTKNTQFMTAFMDPAPDVSVSGTATAMNLVLKVMSGLSAGTYTKVTVDEKGRVTAATTLGAGDIPTLTAAKISDFDTAVRSNKLNQLAAPDGDVAMNSRKITGLAEPTAGTDAATKNYVDNAVQGLDPKPSVVAASTANQALSGITTLPGIDGQVIAVGDRVLLKNQTTAHQNGIYVLTGNAASWSFVRATDADSWDELISAYVWVEKGTNNADTGWVCTVDRGGTLGSSAIAWNQFAGAGQLSFTAPLTKTGNTVSLSVSSDFTVNGSNQLAISSTVVIDDGTF